MPDFRVRIIEVVDSIAKLTFPGWADEPDGDDPTRLNALAHVPLRYARVGNIGPETVSAIAMVAIVDGVEAPADAALGGRLFRWSMGTWPLGYPIPTIVSPVGGKTSLATIPIFGAYPGHWAVCVERPGSGQILVPYDVELGT